MMEMLLLWHKKLAKCGLGVGISSGANFIGALMLQNKLGKDSVIVTVFPDDNKKISKYRFNERRKSKRTFLIKRYYS